MGRVVHFEISADDPIRAVRFYESVFGWEIKKWEGPMEYWLVMTGAEKEPGIDGAIMQRSLPGGSGTVLTVDIKDAKETVTKIIEAGGLQLTEIDPVPGVGLFCYCQDTEGNCFGIMQWIPKS